MIGPREFRVLNGRQRPSRVEMNRLRVIIVRGSYRIVALGLLLGGLVRSSLTWSATVQDATPVATEAAV